MHGPSTSPYICLINILSKLFAFNIASSFERDTLLTMLLQHKYLSEKNHPTWYIEKTILRETSDYSEPYLYFGNGSHLGFKPSINNNSPHSPCDPTREPKREIPNPMDSAKR